ncbi:MAG: Mov34/MPN/PAD-1 family protein [bacterium]
MEFVFTSSDGLYQVVLPTKVVVSFSQYCTRAHPKETGGIIIGHYTQDGLVATITKATPPPRDSKAGSNWFIRGTSGLRSFLEKWWERPDRRYYLGEWHYHPALVVEPSVEDIKQMIQISEDRKYSCPEPIMLIMGSIQQKKRSVRAYVFPRRDQMIELF